MQVLLKTEKDSIPVALEKEDEMKYALKVFNGTSSIDLELSLLDMRNLREAIQLLIDL